MRLGTVPFLGFIAAITACAGRAPAIDSECDRDPSCGFGEGEGEGDAANAPSIVVSPSACDFGAVAGEDVP